MIGRVLVIGSPDQGLIVGASNFLNREDVGGNLNVGLSLGKLVTQQLWRRRCYNRRTRKSDEPCSRQERTVRLRLYINQIELTEDTQG